MRDSNKTGGQGYRSDLLQVQQKIQAGEPLETIADENFALWCQYGRAFEKYSSMKQKGRSLKMVWGFIGMAGTGKTSLALKILTEETGGVPYIYREKPGDWWNGYNGQRGVIMDDFKGKFDGNQFLGLLDPVVTKMDLMIKGGSIPCAVTHVIFTSNHSPWTWYPSDTVTIGALLRRFNAWWIFDGAGRYPRAYISTEAVYKTMREDLTSYDLNGVGKPCTEI